MTECYRCGQEGHHRDECPADLPLPAAAPFPASQGAAVPAAAKPKTSATRGLSDQEIISRILRIYSPASELEMRGLVNTWRRDYTPGNEYPEAPRYPPGFIALCRARQQARTAHSY